MVNVTLPNYSRVRLLTDCYQKEGVLRGAIGYIIEVYAAENYEVEFSREDGTTLAQIVVKSTEIEWAERDEP